MHEHVRRFQQGGLPRIGWPERIMGALLGVLVLLVALAFGVLIFGILAVAALVLAARVWWWRRRLRGLDRTHPVVIEGEYRVLESPRADSSRGGSSRAR